MSKPKLLLHLGTHKTGTTYIQQVFHDRRAEFRDLGILYPDNAIGIGFGTTGHHALAHLLARTGPTPHVRLALSRVLLMRQARRHALTVVSAEPFYRHSLPGPGHEDWSAAHERYLRRVRHYFRAFDVMPLLYFRRPDDFAISLYKENVARALTKAGGLGAFLEDRARRFDYPTHVAVTTRVFGTLESRSYEVAARKDLVRDMFDLVGMVLPPGPEVQQVRQSVTNRAALWLERARREAGDAEHEARVVFAIRHAASPIFADPPGTTLWPSERDRIAFCQRYAASFTMFDNDPDAPSSRVPARWRDDDHATAGSEFAGWRAANAALLVRRARRRTPFYGPDPAA